MSEGPQTSAPVVRGPGGKIGRGGGSLNPGGQPKWLRHLRKDLAAGSVEASKLLLSIIDGTAKDTHVTEGGVEIAISPKLKDQLKALELWFSYMVPKPKQEVGVTTGHKTLTPEQAIAALAVVTQPH